MVVKYDLRENRDLLAASIETIKISLIGICVLMLFTVAWRYFFLFYIPIYLQKGILFIKSFWQTKGYTSMEKNNNVKFL